MMTSIWDTFTSKKEYSFPFKDKYDRALTNYTTNANIFNPTVSIFLLENGFRPKFPDNKPFACCISHDIDVLFKKTNKIELLKSAIRLKPLRLLNQIQSNFSRVIDSRFDLQNILAIDNKYGVKASYYFLSTTSENPEDHNYDLSEIQQYFAELQKHGHEIGLHGSRLVSNNKSNLNIESERLKQFLPITGYRSHFLKFEIPTTWNILAEEGFTYDTTFGAASCPGFRNGMCHPFRPFDLNKNQYIDLFEIPLIAMDVSFFRYLNLNDEDSFELFKVLVEKVKKANGVFTFLWHNNYVQGKMKVFYEKCLQHLKDQNTWFATGNEVIEWWKQNDYFSQQQEILETARNA